MNPLRVASVQFQHLNQDKAANLEIITRFVQDAVNQNVQLIVFPECCISGYWGIRNLDREALLKLAEPIPDGPATQRLLELSAQHNITIGGGLVEVDDAGELFNSYVVAMPDGRIACHRKLHCFVNEHMSSGNAFTVFDLPDGTKAAVLICYDNNIVENVRVCALMGAEILLAPHQTGGCRSGSPFAMGVIDVELWEQRKESPRALEAEFQGEKGRKWLLRWLPARAHDNGLFLIFSNGVGRDDDEVRTGNAMILDPYGRILNESKRIGDDMVVADLDPTLRERCTGVRWIKARRPDLYQLITDSTGNEQDTRSVRFDFKQD